MINTINNSINNYNLIKEQQNTENNKIISKNNEIKEISKVDKIKEEINNGTYKLVMNKVSEIIANDLF